MFFSYRLAALSLVVLVGLFFLLKPARLQNLQSPLQYLKASGKTSPEILNGTLGFQEVLVINLPERTDRRDALTLAAALSKIKVTWIDGVVGQEVPDKVLPSDSFDKKISIGNKGSWRAHMDALQRVVDRNITSALILEDDADWDIMLKSQLQVFAQAARAFTQPKPRSRLTLATKYGHDAQTPTEISLDQIPTDLQPTITPYGDEWDVLWLGHCGTEFPTRSAPADKALDKDSPNRVADPSHQPPLLRVLVENDPTVPGPENLKPHPFALKDKLADIYAPHTRVVHASSATICTQAYAVSQQGARKLLWQFGLETLTNGWDFMLRDWCDGLYATTETQASEQEGMDTNTLLVKGPVCVTVQPPLFSHHYGKGAASDITAPGGGFINKEKEMTPYIRYSVRLNMGKLLHGAGLGDLVDQFRSERRKHKA